MPQKKLTCAFTCLLICLAAIFLMGSVPSDTEDTSGSQQTRVPLSVEISHNIAGVQIKFAYTEGLVFVKYEQSQAVAAGAATPIVEKDGFTILGFFSGANIFAPQNGVLDLGNLVFEIAGEDAQTVTVSEIKLVELIDSETTSDEILGPISVSISSEGLVDLTDIPSAPAASPSAPAASPSSAPTDSPIASLDNSSAPVDTPTAPVLGSGSPDEEPAEDSNANSNASWIIAVVAVVVVAAIIVLIVILRKRNTTKAETE